MPRKLRIPSLIALIIVSASSSHAAGSSQNMNFRFSPLSILVGAFDINLDYRLNDQWTIGPRAQYLNLSANDISASGGGLGVESIYSFTETYSDGWYLNLGGFYSNIEVTVKNRPSGETLSASGNGLNLYGGAGYHWFWDSFNINLGLILNRSSNSKIEVKDSNGTVTDSYTPTASLGIDFKMGFTF